MWPFSGPDTCAIASQAKHKAREDAITAVTLQIPNATVHDDLPFLSASARQIAENIRTKKTDWTATRVLHAYIRSAIRAHERTNPLTEICFEYGLKKAKELDAAFAKSGKLVGPLHGVPLSLKEHLKLKDFDASMGFSDLCNKPMTETTLVIKLLENAGAVPFVKTNIPQTMLAFECQNPVFGRTTNPYNKHNTAGGSSGGEAALISQDGSPIGIGSDIGGSLRIPAHYSGCYGFKSWNLRMPLNDIASPSPGFESINVVLGPMGRTVDDLELVCQVVFDSLATSSIVRTSGKVIAAMPFKNVDLPKRLKFGYFKSDSFVTASPACQRAVQESVDALRKQGHELIELDDVPALEAMCLFVALSSSDGYQTLMSGLKTDPHESALFLIDLQRRLGSTMMHGFASLVSYIDTQFAAVAGVAGKRDVSELMKYQHQRDTFVKKYRTLYWGALGLDAIVCPVQAMPAIPCGTGWNLAFIAAATIIWNIIDSAAGSVPVTFVDAEKDALTPEWAAKHPVGSAVIERTLYGAKRTGGVYNAEEMHGLPVGIQMVAPFQDEEKLLKMMKVLDHALGPRGYGPGEFSKKMYTSSQL